MPEYTFRAGSGPERRELMERCGGVFPDFLEGQPDDGARYIITKVECDDSEVTLEFMHRQIIEAARNFGASQADLDELAGELAKEVRRP